MKNNKTVQQTELTPLKGEAEVLIARAIDKNISVESLERLLEMRRQIKADRAKEEFDHAMASFQAMCPTIERRKQGYNYKYAPLESIVEQVKELLSRNGFSYTFDTDNIENAVIVYCKVKHIAGHMEVSKARIEHETTTKMNSSQQSGASMTYGKRYAFCNAFGILTGDEDTDARGATPVQMRVKIDQNLPQIETIHNVPDQTPIEDEGSQIEPELITSEQHAKIIVLMKNKGKSFADLSRAVAAFKKEYLKQLTEVQADKLIEKLETLDDIQQAIV